MTEMPLIEAKDIAALDPTSEAVESWQINHPNTQFSESDLLRIKMPQDGVVTWAIQNGEVVNQVDAIEGILVFKSFKGTLWASQTSQKGAQPCFISNDLLTCVRNPRVSDAEMNPALEAQVKQYPIAGKPGVYDWQRLPLTQFGSGQNGGKYANEQLQLFMLPDNAFIPVIVQVSSASMPVVKQFFMQCENIPYFRMKLRLTLIPEKAKTARTNGSENYSKLVVTQIGKLSREAGNLIRAQYTNYLQAQHDAALVPVVQFVNHPQA